MWLYRDSYLAVLVGGIGLEFDRSGADRAEETRTPDDLGQVTLARGCFCFVRLFGGFVVGDV